MQNKNIRQKQLSSQESEPEFQSNLSPESEGAGLEFGSPHIAPPPNIQRLLSQKMTPANLITLQRTLGNRAATNIMRSRLATVQREDDAVAGQTQELQGSLPDSQPFERSELEKGPEPDKSDGAGGKTSAQHRDSSKGGKPASGVFTLNASEPAFTFNNPQTELSDDANLHAADTVAVETVDNAFANPGNKVTSPFGSESFIASYKGLTWKATKSEKTGGEDTINISFTLDINCPWGVNSGGKTDVPSGTDGVVTLDPHSSGKKVYEQIVADLTPSLKEKSWVAPRSHFWSKAICERHEKFHSTDDKGWSEGAGKQVVIDYLKGKTVAHDKIDADLKTHMDNAMKEMQTANFNWYKGGAATYYSYAGEIRAFGDGKQPYLDLVADVKKQGEKLEKEAAAAKSGAK
jgi:hypothetical protein